MKYGKWSFVTLLPYFLNILTFLSWERLSFALKLFFKNDHTWMNYPLVLSDLKTFDFQLLLIRDNNTSFEVNNVLWSINNQSLLREQTLLNLSECITQFVRIKQWPVRCVPVLVHSLVLLPMLTSSFLIHSTRLLNKMKRNLLELLC